MDKSNWEYKKCGEVFDLFIGKTPSRKDLSLWNDGSHPWVSISDMEGKYISKTKENITDKAIEKMQVVPANTAIMSFKLTIGRTAITKCPLYTNEAIMAFPVKQDYNIDPNFFYYYLPNVRWARSSNRAVMGYTLNKKSISDTTIAIPPLPTQHQIVSELDQLSAIISLKQQQIKEYDALTQSLFCEMFGDPSINEKGWQEECLKNISKEKLSYGSGASAIPFDGNIRYIRITDIDSDGYLLDSKVSPSKIDEKYILHDGDILFARSGATVGKTYKYQNSDGAAIYAGYLIRLIPNQKVVLPTYVFYYTKTRYYLNFIEKAQRAVAQPNINAQQYGNLKICLPPIELQQSFTSKVQAIEHQKSLLKQSIAETQTLLDSRMQEYFG